MADQVRDRRTRGWSWFDNEVVQQYGAALGPYGIAVYIALLTFADSKDQTCFPSHQQIAEMTRMSRRHVIRSVQALKELRLIRVTTRGEGPGQASNLYTILTPGGSDYQSQGVVTTSHRGSDYQSHELDSFNQTQLNQTQLTISPSSPSSGDIPPTKNRTREKAKAKSTCPDTYQPTSTQANHAVQHGIPLATEVERFLHHHRSRGNRMLSWEDAFWTWLYNYDEFKPRQHHRARPAGKPTELVL